MPETFFSPERQRMTKEPVVRFTRRDQEGLERKFVAVLGVELPVYEGKDGSFFHDEEFKEFSLDEASLDLLKRYATAVKLNQPLLVEGETDIGKTKALEYLAHLCNRRLYRLSLSGQTDVSEFVGKYVPNTEDGSAAFERILRSREKLSGTSKGILADADQAGRGLTEKECRVIAKTEGLAFGDKVSWVWQDGLLIKAMKHGGGKGAWLYLDELGAAEPQILVKLNRVFEKFGRMEVAENGNRVIEAGPDFRILASTNPPEYAGRLPFAPDFLRRWVYQKVGSLSEPALRSRLKFRFRKQSESSEPLISRFGVVEDKSFDFSKHPKISEAAEELLVALFDTLKKKQAAGLGRDQRQQFRFEFSDLERIYEYASHFGSDNPFLAMKTAVEFYFANKLGKPEDRKKVMDAFDVVAKAKQTQEKMKVELENRQPVVSEEVKASRAAAKSVFDSTGELGATRAESPETSSAHLESLRELLGGTEAWSAYEVPTLESLGLDTLLDPRTLERLYQTNPDGSYKLTPEQVTTELDKIAYVKEHFPLTQSKADKDRGLTRFRPSWWSEQAEVQVQKDGKWVSQVIAPTNGLAYLRSIAQEIQSLQHATILLDTAVKPNYTDGSQHYNTRQNPDGSLTGKDGSLDPLLPIFQEVFGATANRFNHSFDDLQTKLLPKLKEKIQVHFTSQGLSSTDFDVILTPFHTDQQFMVNDSPESSSTDTWEWTNTPFIDQHGIETGRRLLAGRSGDGGSGYVRGVHLSVGFGNGGARLAVVLRRH